MDFNQIFELLIGPGGLVAGMMFALLAFYKGWVHTDAEFQQERKEKLLYRGALFETAMPAVASLSETSKKAVSALQELKGE